MSNFVAHVKQRLKLCPFSYAILRESKTKDMSPATRPSNPRTNLVQVTQAYFIVVHCVRKLILLVEISCTARLMIKQKTNVKVCNGSKQFNQ